MTTINTFTSTGFEWLNHPKEWASNRGDGETEGSGGDFTISSDRMTLKPPAFKDFWARTFYTPLLIKHDASAYVYTIPAEDESTVAIDFQYTPQTQFDQAGLMVYIDNSHWLKCGIEYCDGTPRLSVVVCNVFSDWSTQPWSSCGARLRLHKVIQSSSVVVEAAPLGSEDFQFIRIAHLSAKATHIGDDLSAEEVTGSHDEKPWRIGPFAACPNAQKGCVAEFSALSIGPRVKCVHDDDVSHMVS